VNTIEDIERAIDGLPAADVTRLAAWLLKRDHEAWDRQMQEDDAAGRLDFLFVEAEAESKAGTLRDWPPAVK